MSENGKKESKKKPTPPPVDKTLYVNVKGSYSGKSEKDKKNRGK